MADKRILIVEDDRTIRETVRDLLTQEGYRVQCASNGKEGIVFLRGDTMPDVVLLDMMMPQMNGWDFLDVLRGDPKTAKVPVIVLSAYGEIAKSVKPRAFLPKPVELHTLLSVIQAVA